jgi:hypothetical protein
LRQPKRYKGFKALSLFYAINSRDKIVVVFYLEDKLTVVNLKTIFKKSDKIRVTFLFRHSITLCVFKINIFQKMKNEDAVTSELKGIAKIKLEVIQSLLEPSSVAMRSYPRGCFAGRSKW